jgi:PAS domain S-box-containing protein
MRRADGNGRHGGDEELRPAKGLDPPVGRLRDTERSHDALTVHTPDDVPLKIHDAESGPGGAIADLTGELALAHDYIARQAADLEHTRQLLESERERFRELFEVAPEGHIITDAAGTIREANRAVAALLNIPIDYLIGKPLAVFIAPADRRAFRVRVYRARVDGAEESWTVSLNPRDGDTMRAFVAASPVLDARGAITGLRWLIRDVSNRRAGVVWDRTPAAILRSAIDALSTHVVVMLADGTIVTVNRAWRDASVAAGLFDRAAPGSNYLDLCDAAMTAGRAGASVARSAVARVLDGTVVRSEALYSDAFEATSNADANRSENWYALRVTRCDGPEPAMVVATHDDVTIERRANTREKALLTERSARAAAEAASHAKTEFLTTLSHELRTPLNAIGGYAQLLEMGIRGPVTPEQAEDLRRILRSEQHLLGLINELLTFARVERGEVTLTCSRVPANDCVLEVVELIEPQAMSKSIKITVECSDDDLEVIGDGDKLRQIFINLLTNAVKFTPRGGSVRVTCTADHELVTIGVHDTGIGIPYAKQSVVFDPFVQVHRGTGSPSEGIGLGLAISRDLARAMGGDLTVQSEPGVGSSFEVSLSRATSVASLS